MVQHDKFTENLMELEKLLVRQFRALQELIEKTRVERNCLIKGDDSLMRIVEDKEALLDRLNLMEDARRELVQNLTLVKDVHSEKTSISQLLPFLDEDVALRLSRMADGISTLAYQARELNYANQALSNAKLDWLRAAQSFLIGVTQPEPGYRPQGVVPSSNGPTCLGVEFRA